MIAERLVPPVLAAGLFLSLGAAVATPVAAPVLAALVLAAGVAAAAAWAVRVPASALGALALLLAVFPVARVELGPVPLYATDALVGLAAVAVAARRGPAGGGFGRLVGLYLAAWLPAWLVQMVTLDLVLEPTYGLLRNLLAVLVFFVAVRVVPDELDPRRLVGALAAGAIVTSVVALAQRAPGTAPFARELLERLAPDFAPAAYRTYADRSFALFAAATILAGFLATILPLLLACGGRGSGRHGRLAGAAAALAAVGLLSTYSRQWLPALAVGLVVLAALKRGTASRVVLLGATASIVAAASFGGGTLDRSYLEERFGRLGPDDANVRVRLERQREFLESAGADPVAAAVGRGFAGQDIVARGAVDAETAARLRAGVNDNVFLLEVFNHGIFAGVLYAALLLAAFARAVSAARLPGPYSDVLAGLAASLASATALHFLDNYYSETVFMKTLLWLLIGAAVALSAKARREAA